MGLRLVKAIARSGVASRRKAGDLVKAGKVTVNGKKTLDPSLDVNPQKDHIKVNGQHLPKAAPPVYLALHKPAGFITTKDDPQGRPTVMSLLETVKANVFPIGRLDRETEGLLMFTNDGDVAQALSHPKFRARRVYKAGVSGRVRPDTMRRIREGIPLKDGIAKPESIKILYRGDKHTNVRIILSEGRNRLVRRMMLEAGHPVINLKREKFGPIELEDLKPGKFRYLNEGEIQMLRKLVKK